MRNEKWKKARQGTTCLVIVGMHIESDSMQDKDAMRLAASICGVKLFALSLIVSTKLRNACCIGP